MTELTRLEDQAMVERLRETIEDWWPMPDTIDSYLFLVSEIGEVGDALLRAGYGHRADYVRNHPDRMRDLKAELGQVSLMLCTLASTLDINLHQALTAEVSRIYGQYRNHTRRQ